MNILRSIIVSALCVSSSLAQDKEWTVLFDGKSLDQWTKLDGKPIEKGWKVSEGTIHRHENGGGDIISKESYENFILEFEWKISVAGNSGVKYRAKGNLGLEYQVLDDEKHGDGKNPTHRTASLYDLLAAPDDKPVKPVGEWNKGRIVAKGPLLEHWLNGVKVLSIDQSGDDWEKRFAASKYRDKEGFGKGAGHLLLQDHNDAVWFRRIRVKKLD